MGVTNTAGYSGTPLARKLGITESSRVWVVGAPENFASLMVPLPDGAVFEKAASSRTDIVHLFVTRREELAKALSLLRRKLRPDAAVWVSWPKKSSKVPTTVSENVVRDVALPIGFVDVKVCAVDNVWSGLKLVVRRELR